LRTTGAPFYFDNNAWECRQCGSLGAALGIWVGLLFGVLGGAGVIYLFYAHPDYVPKRLRRLAPTIHVVVLHASRLGLQGKIKTLITFFQICSVC